MKKAASKPGAAPLRPERLLALLHKRLLKFTGLVPRFLISDDADTIHDLRVASRRLQQALRVLYSGSKPPKRKKVFRLLRRTRQALGPCRNLDVNLDLIKDKQQRAGAAAVERAWGAVRATVEAQRRPLVEAGRCEVRRRDLFRFISRTQALIAGASSRADPGALLDIAIEESMTAWQTAYAAAMERRDPVQLHQFRIAGKRLRYQVELLADLGQTKAKSMVAALERILTDAAKGGETWARGKTRRRS